MTIPAEGKALVKTDIAIALPEGCYGRVGTCCRLSSNGVQGTPSLVPSARKGLVKRVTLPCP